MNPVHGCYIQITVCVSIQETWTLKLAVRTAMRRINSECCLFVRSGILKSGASRPHFRRVWLVNLLNGSKFLHCACLSDCFNHHLRLLRPRRWSSRTFKNTQLSLSHAILLLFCLLKTTQIKTSIIVFTQQNYTHFHQTPLRHIGLSHMHYWGVGL